MKNCFVVPIDFTEISRNIVQMADEIALRNGSKLHFLHVIPQTVPHYSAGGYGGYVWADYYQELPSAEDQISQYSDRLNNFIHSFEPKSPFECQVESGVPYLRVLELQDELDARMIFMSAHDHTLLGRLFLGSNTSYVLHHAKCPVYIYKEHDDNQEWHNEIIVPIGLTEIDKQVVHQSDEWAKQIGATLHFCHSATLGDPRQILHEDHVTGYKFDDDEISEKLEMNLKGFVNFCKVESTYKCWIKEGKPYIDILELQEETNARLVIMSAHEHTMIGRLLRGSTTDYVLNHAKCPILVHKDSE